MNSTPTLSVPLRSLVADRSLWVLVAANVMALGLALYDGWRAVDLMAAYWAQSVIIGIANYFRIRGLDRFSTEGFSINNKPAQETPDVRRSTANFFALHYGLFHAVYFMFLSKQGGIETFSDLWFLVAAATFAVNHFFSYRVNAARDRQGRPNIGTLMFLPYLRVIPMHLTVIVGGLIIASPAALLLFGMLKTAADVAMHAVEHALLRKGAVQAAP